MPWLTIIKNGEEQGSFPIESDFESGEIPFVTIGSDPGNAICLREEGVEAFHAILSAEGGRFIITDQGTAAGVFRNGRLVTGDELEDNDRLIFGSVELVFRTGVEEETPGKRRAPLLIAAFLTGVVLLAGGGWYWFSGRSPDSGTAVVVEEQSESPETPIGEEVTSPETSKTPDGPEVAVTESVGDPAATVAMLKTPDPATPEPASSGPIELFPFWEMGKEYLYLQEETKRTVSPSDAVTLKVTSEARIRIETRKGRLGSNPAESTKFASVGWPQIRIERTVSGTKEIFDSAESGRVSPGAVGDFGRKISEIGALVPIKSNGMPNFVRSPIESMRSTRAPGDSWWDIPSRSLRPALVPAQLAVLPPLARRLPLGVKSEPGARWSDEIRFNIHDELFGTLVANAEYHFERLEGNLAVISISGDIAADSVKPGLSLDMSEVTGTIRIDPVRRVLTNYDVTIRLKASRRDADPLTLEQHLLARLLEPASEVPDPTPAPSSLDTPRPEPTAPAPPSPPETPSIPALTERLQNYQKTRKEKVAELVLKFRGAVRKEAIQARQSENSGQQVAAETSLRDLDAWNNLVVRQFDSPEVRPLPELSEKPENASPALVNLRKILEDELSRIESELGNSLQTSLGNLVAQLAKDQQSDEAYAVLTFSKALRTSFPHSFGDNENAEWLIGTLWQLNRADGNNYIIEIREEAIKQSGIPKLLPYQIGPGGAVKYRALNINIELHFDENQKSGNYLDSRGTRGTLIRIN